LGVSDVVNDAANMLERLYPVPAHITACGLGEGRDFRAAYPDVTYQKIEVGKPLPFRYGAFDIATSNAVLEHVGSADAQQSFVRELCRVGRRVFITVPNRSFPLEHHTALPLVHYLDRPFHMACRVTGKQQWSDPANLILMTRKRLWRLVAGIDRSVAIGYTGLRFGPFS